MRDIEVKSGWMTTVLAVLATPVCVILLAHEVVMFVHGQVHPVGPAGWIDYLATPYVMFLAFGFWRMRKEFMKTTYKRMVLVIMVLALIGLTLSFVVALRPALTSNPQLEWSGLLLGIALWSCVLIGLVDWFRTKVRIVRPPFQPPHDLDSSL
jgi:uncharacterized membrane protein